MDAKQKMMVEVQNFFHGNRNVTVPQIAALFNLAASKFGDRVTPLWRAGADRKSDPTSFIVLTAGNTAHDMKTQRPADVRLWPDARMEPM